MRKNQLIAGILLAATTAAAAFDVVWVRTNLGINEGLKVERLKEIKYSEDKANLIVSTTSDEEAATIAVNTIEDAVFGESEGTVYVTFADGEAVVDNPLALEGVSAKAEGAKVTLTCNTGTEVKVNVSGTTTAGGLKIYGDDAVSVTLNNANITNDSGSAINLQTTTEAEIVLAGSSVLGDSKKYATPAGESEKGAVYSVKALTIKGSGKLSVSALNKHAICSDGKVKVKGGDISVTSAASDGIHSSGFTMSGGKYTSRNTGGDGIDADKKTADIKGGEIDIEITTADVKGIKADSDITIDGGKIKLNVASDQGKGFKTKANMIINDGEIEATLSGATVVTDGDPSYCTAIKVDADFTMNGGKLTVNGTSSGNKGVSTDGVCTFNDGEVTMTLAGDAVAYVDASGNNDTYSTSAIKADGTLNVNGGRFNITNSGSAGKGIKCDGEATFGTAESGPEITITMTGDRVKESGTSSGGSTGGGGRPGGGGWGPGGGGFDPNGDYANPKAIKIDGNLTLNSGTYNLTCTKDGGEALESKQTLTINGGTYDLATYDDCINAANHIQINGGAIKCIASGNDAIDSNGTMTIAGGVVVACGARSPECGFDCDNNRFAITGGYVFGMGGSTSTPTASACTQRVLVYSKSVTKNQLLTITDPNGKQVISIEIPQSLSSAKMVISAPGITTGTHTVYTGGTVSGGTTVFGVTYGATFSGGTKATTFSPTSMVTSK